MTDLGSSKSYSSVTESSAHSHQSSVHSHQSSHPHSSQQSIQSGSSQQASSQHHVSSQHQSSGHVGSSQHLPSSQHQSSQHISSHQSSGPCTCPSSPPATIQMTAWTQDISFAIAVGGPYLLYNHQTLNATATLTWNAALCQYEGSISVHNSTKNTDGSSCQEIDQTIAITIGLDLPSCRWRLSGLSWITSSTSSPSSAWTWAHYDTFTNSLCGFAGYGFSYQTGTLVLT